jgi:murein DD-endopeptidase MepM/ murein hydrolase activator NlpD
MHLLMALMLSSGWLWPVASHQVAVAYDPPNQDWDAGHRGVDLEAETGTAVHSIGPGTVAYVGSIGDIQIVTVQHAGSGLRSTYQPVEALVEAGDHVEAGTLLGLLASSGGHCAGICLHLGLKAGDAYRDPMLLLRRQPAILKPARPRAARTSGEPG